jgi:hypothetical protein
MRAASKRLVQRGVAYKVMMGASAGIFLIASLGIAQGPAGLGALSEYGIVGSWALGGTTHPSRRNSDNKRDNTREGALLKAEDELSKQAKKFYKKIKRKVPSISTKEIDDMLADGFDNGTFCGTYKLMTPREIRKHIISKFLGVESPAL